ncbi:hypothetical protein Forpi1262_v009639 [Fusarium oxysporum f. sp. raphani]|uniref:Chromo domain-containing protein n=1 Tax=Fusarium oxysporum f. sp. raphani TaxID=96318 RepID=A0A8J5PVH1_FUSOX|nr:hypothetical protein Forpi1262_v009639 [Fusarium oxysporum f. sp. raphani]
MDDSDSESIVSTIVSEHDSDEEWTVNEILAEWPIDGLPRYLIEWENFDLCEATWEPAENLSNALLEGWEKTKPRDDFDMFKNIRDWKNAVKSKYAAKLDRHQERNRRRRLRGEEETSFVEMEDHLKWADRFPDGEEPSGSVVSSPSVVTDIDMDVEVGQLSQHFDKTQRASASLSEDSSPKSSHRNSIVSVHQPPRPPMNSAATTTSISSASSTSQKPPLRRQPSKVLADNKRPPQKPVASSNLLSSKFGVRGPIKRTDSHLRKGQPTKARKTRPAQAFTGNVFSGGTVRKQRTTLAEAAKDSTKQSKLLKPRYVRIIQKAGRDRESAAPAKLPTDLISLNPAERSADGLTALPLRPEIPNETVKPIRQNKNSAEIIPEAPKPKPKKSISWGTVEEATIPARGEREESLFLREDSLIRATTSIKIEDDPREAETNTGPQSESTFQTKASDNQECWAGRAPVMNDESGSSKKSITTEVQFGPGSRETFSVIFERDEDQNGQPWSGIFEQHPILIFTHSCMTRDFWSQETAMAAAKLGTGSVTSNGDLDSLATVANWLCPQQAWAFFKWAYKYWLQHRGAFTLIVCAEFENWVHEVAVGVKEDWETHLESIRVREEDKATAEKEIDALFKCSQHAREITGPSDDDQPALVFAPDSIDGNDEQSLVNWFGWWSVLNLDQYRHFTVLGSSPNAGIQRLTHQIRIPQYTPSTLGNPGDVWGKANPAGSSLVAQNQSAVERTPQKSLQLIPRDDAVSFKHFLGQLENNIRDRDWGPQAVFTCPVSYWNMDMAHDFPEFETYDRCLRYFNERIHGHTFINTGVAFCYTIEGSWKYGDNREATNKNQRPWIAVYRPIEVFKKPWRAMELIIWDPVMKMPDNDPYVYDGELIEAQREMIRLAEEPHNKMPLAKVWIGGPDVIPQGLTDPVDITIHQLQHLMRNLKASIPAVPPVMISQGWREVRPGNAPIRSRPPSLEAMDIDEPTDTNNAADEDLKIVFHAPRGKNMDRPTKCKNRLFMHYANKRSEGYRGRTMNFVFRPTLDWYDEQVQEGRGFEHIRVMPWPAFFSKHSIEVPERPDMGSERRAKEANN